MLALILFILTLTLVIWQPRGLGIGWSALGGAAVALATGVIVPADIAVVWHIVWDATFTFVALIVISLVLDAAGFFSWAALRIARASVGSSRTLFVATVLLGAAISAVFANDGAALLLTPIVVAIVLRLGLPPASALAFIFATGFIADTASVPLVISNLVNIVSANYFGIGFTRYASVMIPVDLVSIAATLGVLWLAFGRHLPARHTPPAEDPRTAIRDPLVFRTAAPLLALLLAAYVILGRLHWPFSIVTGAGALFLLAIAGRWWRAGRGAVLPLTPILRSAPWQIVLFSLGMYLVVYGLGNAGLTQVAARILEHVGSLSPTLATVITGFLAAAMASVMNNLPSTLVSALAVAHAQVPELTHQLMIYAAIIGNDLGPKLTPIGSLATLLWLHVLARNGQRITWGMYLRVGLLLTPPILFASLLALALWLPLLPAS